MDENKIRTEIKARLKKEFAHISEMDRVRICAYIMANFKPKE